MRARGSIRFSLGRYNSEEEVDYLLSQLPPILAKLRSISPLDANHQDNHQFDLQAARQRHGEEEADSRRGDDHETFPPKVALPLPWKRPGPPC